MAYVVYFMNWKHGAISQGYYIYGYLDFVSIGNGTFVCKTALHNSPQLNVH